MLYFKASDNVACVSKGMRFRSAQHFAPRVQPQVPVRSLNVFPETEDLIPVGLGLGF
jgi:hypothetical protein